MEIEMMEMSSPSMVFLVVPLRHKAHNTQKIKQRTRMHLKLICLSNMFFCDFFKTPLKRGPPQRPFLFFWFELSFGGDGVGGPTTVVNSMSRTILNDMIHKTTSPHDRFILNLRQLC